MKSKNRDKGKYTLSIFTHLSKENCQKKKKKKPSNDPSSIKQNNQFL